jgi:hypothetical protein
MKSIVDYISGGDLRTLEKVDRVIRQIKSQNDFDQLFKLLFSDNRLIVMRAADAVEKITISHPEYLQPHKSDLLEMLNIAANKELKWHLVLLIARVSLDNKEVNNVWTILMNWASNKDESRIVRVNSLQSLFELTKQYPKFTGELKNLMSSLQQEEIPSIKARLNKLKKQV